MIKNAFLQRGGIIIKSMTPENILQPSMALITGTLNTAWNNVKLLPLDLDPTLNKGQPKQV